MKLELSKEIAQLWINGQNKPSAKAIDTVKSAIRFGSASFKFDSNTIEESDLDLLYNVSKENGERALMMQLTSLRNLLTDPVNTKVGNLKALPDGIKSFVAHDAINGWLYELQEDGNYVPWLVTGIKYVTPMHGDDHVSVTMVANTIKSAKSERKSRDDGSTTSFSIGRHEIVKKTVGEILAANGYIKETPELRAQYESEIALFQTYQPMKNSQFSCTVAGFVEGQYGRLSLVDFPPEQAVKVVNDEALLTRPFMTSFDSELWEDAKGNSKFSEVPYHCYVYGYHLNLHCNVWIHVMNMQPYVYDPLLRDKLVLDESHRDLIDILTTDMDAFQEDVVAGKSGGTTILCKGEPGLGKTLTAEVYAEVVGKPLYKVHSGQLGTTPESVESSLTDILARGQRWGCVMLLDEADVYIRARGDDLLQNAIVAEFLRTLDYFHGLLFLTTNRVNDIDDAIVSRCIAVILYAYPDNEAAKRIWQIQAGLFGVDDVFQKDPQFVTRLLGTFPKVSGRDIRKLMELTTKYCRVKGIPLSIDAFRKCGVFKGFV